MTATPPPMAPEAQKALARKIAIVGVADAVLILAGVGLYLLTYNVLYIVIAAVAGAAAMITFVVVPQVRRQIDAAKSAKGSQLVE